MIPSLYRQTVPLHPARRSSTSSSPSAYICTTYPGRRIPAAYIRRRPPSPYIVTAGGPSAPPPPPPYIRTAAPLPLYRRRTAPTLPHPYIPPSPTSRPVSDSAVFRIPIYPAPAVLSNIPIYLRCIRHLWTMNPGSSPGATSASGCADRAPNGTSLRHRRSVRCARDAGPPRPPWRAPAAGMPGSRAPTSLPRGARSATARTGTA